MQVETARDADHYTDLVIGSGLDVLAAVDHSPSGAPGDRHLGVPGRVGIAGDDRHVPAYPRPNPPKARLPGKGAS